MNQPTPPPPTCPAPHRPGRPSAWPLFRVTLFLLLGLAVVPAPVRGAEYALATTNLLVGPAAGADSVVVAAGAWTTDLVDNWSQALATGALTATANDPWLHLDTRNAGAAGSPNVLFTFDGNPGATRTGTLTIAGQTLTVTQAGIHVVPAAPITLLGNVLPSEFYYSNLVADRGGNLYFPGHDLDGTPVIKKWSAATGVASPLVTVKSDLYYAMAVDGTGNFYFYDGEGSIKMRKESDGSLSTLVSGLDDVYSLGADDSGNLYFNDMGVIRRRAADGTLIKVDQGSRNNQLAVDSAGFVSFQYAHRGTSPCDNCPFLHVGRLEPVRYYSMRLVSGEPSALELVALAVDSGGGLYYSESDSIKRWTPDLYVGRVRYPPAPILVPHESSRSIAVDAQRNVYWTSFGVYGSPGRIRVLPRAFVDATSAAHEAAAGSGSVPVVMPAGGSPRSPFTPTSDQPWLSAGSILNGPAEYSFTANITGTARTARLTVLGVPVTITQAAGPEPVLTVPVRLANGDFRFEFSGNPTNSYSVWFSPTVERAFSRWSPLGPATVTSPGQFQFIYTPAQDLRAGFYRVGTP